MPKFAPSILLVALLYCASACGPGFAIATPDGFAQLEDQEDYGYRAASAQGVVLGVRAEPNKPYGSLDFWVDVLDLQLREQGYKAEKAQEVKTARGMTGKQIRYSYQLAGRPHTFWLTIFATTSTVYCVEAGGDSRNFTKVEDSIARAIGSLTI